MITENKQEIVEELAAKVLELVERDNEKRVLKKEKEVMNRIIDPLKENSEMKNIVDELERLEDHVKGIYSRYRVDMKYDLKLTKKIEKIKLGLLAENR